MSENSGSHSVAYLMTRFPKITETFILREMDALEDLGWNVIPFAFVREREYVRHPALDRFLPRTCFAAEHLASTLGVNLIALARHPGRYLAALCATVYWCARSPKMLVRSLIAFPVAIYWATVMRGRGVTHVHAHFATHATYMAYIVSRMTDIGFSFTAHAHDIYMDQTMLAEKAGRATFVVTISEYNRRLLLKACPQAAAKIHVVYCGVDTAMFHPLPNRVRSVTPADQPLQIVTVARLQEYKGVRYLVEACRILKDRGVAFRCLLIGDGPLRGQIEHAIQQHALQDVFRRVGWLPAAEVADCVAQADVVALPSVVAHDGMMEGLPNVLMEALSCSVPVVSTTISGIPELVESGQNGLLTPPADPAALAEAFTTLARDPVLRLRMGVRGRERVLADFDLRKNTQEKARLFAQQEVDQASGAPKIPQKRA